MATDSDIERADRAVESMDEDTFRELYHVCTQCHMCFYCAHSSAYFGRLVCRNPKLIITDCMEVDGNSVCDAWEAE